MGYSHDEWTLLIIHEKTAGNRDAQSHAQIKSKLLQTKLPQDCCWYGRYPLFWASHGVCSLVVGEYKLYHFVWEPPIMCVAWKISRTLGCYVDNESMPLKILFISVSKLELWHLCKSLLPSAKCLSIYFYVESSSSY